MKRIICIALASMLMLCPVTVHAEEMESNVFAGSIQPRYAYATSVSSGLTLSADKAECKSNAAGPNVTKIVATQYLEKKVLLWWDEVDSWSKTSTSSSLSMSNSKSGLDSGTYRVRTVFTVYMGSSSEEIEKISAEKTI